MRTSVYEGVQYEICELIENVYRIRLSCTMQMWIFEGNIREAVTMALRLIEDIMQ